MLHDFELIINYFPKDRQWKTKNITVFASKDLLEKKKNRPIKASTGPEPSTHTDLVPIGIKFMFRTI